MKQLKIAVVLGALSLMMGGHVFAQGAYPTQPMGTHTQGHVQPKPPIYLELDKQEYGFNERIYLRYRTVPSMSSSAWVGMLDAAYPHGNGKENDRHDLTYKYLKSKLQGEMVFAAPKQEGQYDFRLNDGEREYFAVPFRVVKKSFIHELDGVSLILNKEVFKPGESIKVRFKAHPSLGSSAWIGMLQQGFPHGDASENDRHDIAYKYLNNRMTGEFTFTAPKTLGKYDFRLNDSGREFFAVPFTVSNTLPKKKPAQQL